MFMSLFDSHEYVYLLEEIEEKEKNKTNLVKIGRASKSVEDRESALKTGNARKLNLYGVIETEAGQSFAEEKRLHRMFESYNTEEDLGGGIEWFNDVSGDIKLYFDKHTDKLSGENHYLFAKWYENITNLSSGMCADTFKFVKKEIVPFIFNVDVAVLAPPKSGKRIMVQSCSCLLPKCKHIYLIALDRIDMNTQLSEHADYGIVAIPVTNTGKIAKQLKKTLIKEIVDWHGDIIIHFDECDFGSAKTGKFSKFKETIEKFKNSDSELHYIVYSATPEEALFSGKYKCVQFYPGPLYNGADFFLKNNLVRDANPFFNYDGSFSLSSQGITLCEELICSVKTVSVVRLTYKIEKELAFSIAEKNNNLQKAIDCRFGKGKIVVHFYDQNRPFDWSFDNKDGTYGSWINLNTSTKHLLVVCGIATRGTEIGFHPIIHSWHDYRPKSRTKNPGTTYGTYTQAIGRVFHYSNMYEIGDRLSKFKGLDTKIVTYCEKSLFEAISRVHSWPIPENPQEIWRDYTERKISPRVKSENRTQYRMVTVDKKDDLPKGMKIYTTSGNNKVDIAYRIYKKIRYSGINWAYHADKQSPNTDFAEYWKALEDHGMIGKFFYFEEIKNTIGKDFKPINSVHENIKALKTIDS